MVFEDIESFLYDLENYEINSGDDLLSFKNKYGTILKNTLEEYKKLSVDSKKQNSCLISNFKKSFEKKCKYYSNLFSERKNTIQDFDYSLPYVKYIGNLHPLTILCDKLFSIFRHFGFEIVNEREIEDDWHNFSALNIAQNHPARDMQDTFFINDCNVLRTHTTSVQARILEKRTPPIRCATIGRVYRNETVSARANCFFTQFDAFYVDKDVSFFDLKSVFKEIVSGIFGSDISMRIRSSYFPFTSPSVEVDIECTVCNKKGCVVCKNSGWLEVWGGGLIHENVLKNCNIDTQFYSGFALGGGIERLAMLIYHIDDLRLFSRNNLKFLQQFR